jgi:hypothetical protein
LLSLLQFSRHDFCTEQTIRILFVREQRLSDSPNQGDLNLQRPSPPAREGRQQVPLGTRTPGRGISGPPLAKALTLSLSRY